ncbi:LuxR C-terminal-related transcriptional regulator [Streptomyces mirabilis]
MTEEELAALQVPVVVRASDPLTLDAVEAALGNCPQVRLLPAQRGTQAEVLLVLANDVAEETVRWMSRSAAETGARCVPILLVADRISEPQIARVVSLGAVGILPRATTTYPQLVEALKSARARPVEPSPLLAGRLARQLRLAQEADQAHGPQLADREIDVLRLLAEGLDTADIARKLAYSDRTIKNIIHGLIQRLELRNRAHAVAYAVRSGII